MPRFFRIFKLVLMFTALIDHSECDVPLNTEEAIGQMGYPLKKYKLQTQDKYALGLERIPYSKYGNQTIGKPIVLIHGLFFSSYVFTFLNKSLSYSLSDAGYDVWLFNARGTGLSRTYSIYPKLGSAPEMNRISWDFSFHEMGVYDFPAVVDFILNKTGHTKIDVVGYSLGSTIALIGLSEKPEYNDKIEKLVLIAPATRLKSSSYPFSIIHRISFLIKIVMKEQDFFPAVQDPDSAHRFFLWLCSYRIYYPLCSLVIKISEGAINNYNRDTVLSTLTDFPQPMSKKLILHGLQLISSKKFCKFDYGETENLRKYNMKIPPSYDLSKVTASTFILHTNNDILSTIEDVKWLIGELPNLDDAYNIDIKKFGHLSFVMHAGIEHIVNSKVKNALLTNITK